MWVLERVLKIFFASDLTLVLMFGLSRWIGLPRKEKALKLVFVLEKAL